MNEIKCDKIENSQIKELQIEKFPLGRSPNLIEGFFIIGYEDSYIDEKIIKAINKETGFNEYKCRNYPTILYSIGSNYSESIFQKNNLILLIKKIFIIPTVFYTNYSNDNNKPNPFNVIFTEECEKDILIGYSYIFYEKKKSSNVYVYVPKAFLIISQYPFFNIFNKLCIELLEKQFRNKNIEIPIEIQLYNIINYIPAPVNDSYNISFFPSNELKEIVNFKSDKDFILQKKELYSLKQLSGYRISDFDISSIFCILSVNTFVNVYIQLLTDASVAVFTKNIEILTMTIYIFNQLVYPLFIKNNIKIFSPIKYFYCEENSEDHLIGFLCSYNEINNYDPTKEGDDIKSLLELEKINENFCFYSGDYILDLDKNKEEEQFFYIDNIKYSALTPDDYNKIIVKREKMSKFVQNILKSNEEKKETSYLEYSIKQLIKNLKEVSFKKITNKNNGKNISFFCTDENKSNSKIQNIFYQFNLDIAYFYQNIKDGKFNLKSHLNEEELLFYNLFSGSRYSNAIENTIGRYAPEESLIYKTPRLIFENFMNHKNLNEAKDNKIIVNYSELIDKVYSIDKKKEKKNITFLNFYKYYKEKLTKQIAGIVNNKYAKIVINKKNDYTKYSYEYKSINLDPNLLLEYAYILEEMDNEEKKRLFNIENINTDFKPINQTITTRFIYKSMEDYFFFYNLIPNINYIYFSILDIFSLSIHKKKFNNDDEKVIIELFKKLKFSVRKYTEIILSIALRLYLKEKNPKYFKYFNFYKLCIEDMRQYPNDELNYLHQEIEKLNKQNDDNEQVLDDYNFQKLRIVDTKEIESLLSKDDTVNFIISFQENEEIQTKDIRPPKEIYDSTSKILNDYYIDCDPKKIDKKEYEKNVKNLVNYCKKYKEEFPNNINSFLLKLLTLE